MRTAILTTVIFVFAFMVWLYLNTTQKIPTPLPSITSFEACVLAGYPVMETFPRLCKVPNGQSYTEKISSKITYINASTDLIVVDSPLPGSVVASHLSVTGKARGTWYFEASFPLQILDSSGKVIAESVAHAESDWMTTDFVPFKATIEIPASYIGEATLILKKDNPSDLRKNDASVSFPVTKKVTSENLSNIKIYFYNPTLDQGPGGAQCTKAGLVSVTRTIPRTITPIQDAIRLLLTSKVSTEEGTQGATNEFPLSGITLQAASLRNGELTLTFLDPQNKTGGGSCHVNILRNQIEATALQFPEVTSVRLMPEELFQP